MKKGSWLIFLLSLQWKFGLNAIAIHRFGCKMKKNKQTSVSVMRPLTEKPSTATAAQHEYIHQASLKWMS